MLLLTVFFVSLSCLARGRELLDSTGCIGSSIDTVRSNGVKDILKCGQCLSSKNDKYRLELRCSDDKLVIQKRTGSKGSYNYQRVWPPAGPYTLTRAWAPQEPVIILDHWPNAGTFAQKTKCDTKSYLKIEVSESSST